MSRFRTTEWDGQHILDGLPALPPGRYLLEALDDGEPLTADDEAGLVEAITAPDAGQGLTLTEVIREAAPPGADGITACGCTAGVRAPSRRPGRAAPVEDHATTRVGDGAFAVKVPRAATVRRSPRNPRHHSAAPA